MERLTEEDEQGNWILKDIPWEMLHEGKMITREVWEKLYGAFCKLKDYEDTGLSPEEVGNLNEFEGSNGEKYLKELAKHRWIPVTERLPENGKESVLIQVSGRPQVNISLENALEIETYNKYEGWTLETWPEWEGAEVIAWMPLPEPYNHTN